MTAVRPQILVIDDEPQIHRFLSPALDAAGYEPKRADSGQEGLRAIALWNPDAVVLDLGLPDMDGKDVLTRAREFYKGPIIILSARDREAEKIASASWACAASVDSSGNTRFAQAAPGQDTMFQLTLNWVMRSKAGKCAFDMALLTRLTLLGS